MINMSSTKILLWNENGLMKIKTLDKVSDIGLFHPQFHQGFIYCFNYENTHRYLASFRLK